MSRRASVLSLAIAATLGGCIIPVPIPFVYPTSDGRSGASGTMPCSAGSPSLDRVCEWRVRRQGPGRAVLTVENPAIAGGDTDRVVDYDAGNFTDRDGAPIEARREGDTWTLSLPGREYYRFSDAVLTGG